MNLRFSCKAKASPSLEMPGAGVEFEMRSNLTQPFIVMTNESQFSDSAGKLLEQVGKERVTVFVRFFRSPFLMKGGIWKPEFCAVASFCKFASAALSDRDTAGSEQDRPPSHQDRPGLHLAPALWKSQGWGVSSFCVFFFGLWAKIKCNKDVSRDAMQEFWKWFGKVLHILRHQKPVPELWTGVSKVVLFHVSLF